MALPKGPLAAYLGVRNSNMDFNERQDMNQLGVLAKFQALADENRRHAQNLEFRGQERAETRELARETLKINDARQRELTEMRLGQQEAIAKMTHEFRMGGLRNADEKAAETARHNKAMEEIAKLRAEAKAAPGNEILKPTDLMRFIDKDGNHPPVGSTMNDVIQKGYKVGTTQEINMLLAGRGAEATVSQLEKYVDSIWGKEGVEDKLEEGIRKRLTTGASFAIDRARQSNPDLNSYESFGSGTLAPLIRAIGEKGALSDKDVERALNLIPRTGNKFGELPDTSVVARQKMKQLRQWFTETLGKNVGASPAAPSGGWSDDKEKRYQELLRKRGGS